MALKAGREGVASEEVDVFGRLKVHEEIKQLKEEIDSLKTRVAALESKKGK